MHQRKDNKNDSFHAYALKACRVDTLAGAKIAASSGINYIGLHAISPLSFSRSQEKSFQAIVRYLSDEMPDCKPVIVTRSRNAAFIKRVCIASGAKFVQLHEKFENTKIVRELTKEFNKENMTPPLIIKTIRIAQHDDRTGQPEQIIEEARNWSPWVYAFVFDGSHTGGTGIPVDWTFAGKVSAGIYPVPNFIAGGINPDNVVEALCISRASGADAQSGLEINGSKNPHLKNVAQMVKLAAIAQGRNLQDAWAYYRWKRSKPYILFSPTDLDYVDARDGLKSLAWSKIDGIQIDTSDGSIPMVPADLWERTAEEWSKDAWELSPEMPLWIHFFSKDNKYIIKISHSCKDINPHMVGLFVQGSEEEQLCVCHRCLELEKKIGVPVIPSVTVKQIEDGAPKLSEFTKICRHWQITTPSIDQNESQRIERTAAAASLLMNMACRVNLDRSIDLDFLKAMNCKPDGITIGRGLLKAPNTMDGTIDSLLTVLHRKNKG